MNELKIINLIDKDKFDSLSNDPDNSEIFIKYGITKEEQQLIEEVIKETPNISKITKKFNNANNTNTSTQKSNQSLNQSPNKSLK